MKLSHLRPLYEHSGPYASVYLATARHTADAAKAIGLRWRQARTELGRLGADEPTLDAIEALITDRDVSAPGTAVFAADGMIVHSEELPEAPPQQSIRLSPLPEVMPLLECREEPVPHIVVTADRRGADIVTVGRTGRRTSTVEGEQWPIHKPKIGGWRESHFQRSAEETWDANAREIAAAVAREAAAVNAEVIMVGGDVRARELVLERLPEPYARTALAVEHGARSAGASEEAWQHEIARVLREHQNAGQGAVIARFQESYGRGDAVGGLKDVTEALRGGQVETLLVTGPTRGELWYGPEGYQVGTSLEEMQTLGVPQPRPEAAGSVLAQAAAATDADVIFTEDLDLPDRVGALLRFSTT